MYNGVASDVVKIPSTESTLWLNGVNSLVISNKMNFILRHTLIFYFFGGVGGFCPYFVGVPYKILLYLVSFPSTGVYTLTIVKFLTVPEKVATTRTEDGHK